MIMMMKMRIIFKKINKMNLYHKINKSRKILKKIFNFNSNNKWRKIQVNNHKNSKIFKNNNQINNKNNNKQKLYYVINYLRNLIENSFIPGVALKQLIFLIHNFNWKIFKFFT